ncbi:MAG: tripartite tricarboxylate transporter substrate binding protein [Burkholderiales bacterium]|jgi:tripartite-type tricarboxylate transporter receptor subunit TctC|nr:tripartite tricarboxylate transporter substrate binding protein [Burkholderiales bacterium]
MNKIKYLYCFILIAASITVSPAWAQGAAGYPTKAVRFIAPFPPGGSTDLLARLVAQKLTEVWGQQVLVENRGGAAGTIGVELAARAAPDGYTIVMGHVGTFGVNPTLYPKLPYDAIKDFAPVTVLATVPNGMAVHPSLPVKSARDFVALAKAKPGELLYASGGSGSASHLAGEYFKLLTRINMVHVPYKGTAPAMISMISGETTMTITGMVALMPHVKSARLKLLGVATMKRLSIMPGIPTINESGVPGYDANQWYGVLTQAAVPRDIVMKLNADIVKVLARADVKERLAADGAEAVANTPEQFATHIKAEIARWAPVVKASGAKPD